MAGSQDGSKETQRMEHTIMPGATGRQESIRDGSAASIHQSLPNIKHSVHMRKATVFCCEGQAVGKESCGRITRFGESQQNGESSAGSRRDGGFRQDWQEGSKLTVDR